MAKDLELQTQMEIDQMQAAYAKNKDKVRARFVCSYHTFCSSFLQAFVDIIDIHLVNALGQLVNQVIELLLATVTSVKIDVADNLKLGTA